MTERTLVLVKPDGVARNLIGEVLARYERRGLTVVALQLRTADGATSDRHYAEHLDKPFYPSLREFLTSGPLVAAVVEGVNAVEAVRALNGATDPLKAGPGTIRGDFSLVTNRNIVHGSDSLESATREIAIWFPEL